ncbi:MAG: hypothetical protein WCL71_13090 [Deltaproteobacteria bacterium]
MSHDIWSIILLIGLAGWIASSTMLAFKAFPQKGVFDAASGIRWGGALVLFFSVWIIGMLNA